MRCLVNKVKRLSPCIKYEAFQHKNPPKLYLPPCPTYSSSTAHGLLPTDNDAHYADPEVAAIAKRQAELIDEMDALDNRLKELSEKENASKT